MTNDKSAIANPVAEERSASFADFIFSSFPKETIYLIPEITIKVNVIIPAIDNRYLMTTVIPSEKESTVPLTGLHGIPIAVPHCAQTIPAFINKKAKHNKRNKFLLNSFFILYI